MPASSFQQQKLRVCEVCSAYLGLHDNDRRLADHFGGKLHLGFIQIREKLDQLKVCVILTSIPGSDMGMINGKLTGKKRPISKTEVGLKSNCTLILFWIENCGGQAGEKEPGALKETRREGEGGKDEEEVGADI